MQPIRDYKFAVGAGLVASILWFFVLSHLAIAGEGVLIAGLLALPLVFVIAIGLAHSIFKKGMVHKGIKFLIVGVLNTGIDFFIFNALIAYTGINSGSWVLTFKSISFVVALMNSYEMNRLWTFDAESAEKRSKEEFSRFATITLTSFLVNVGATALIANFIHPLFGLSQVRWDNVAAAVATILNLISNFIGYKLYVFISETA